MRKAFSMFLIFVVCTTASVSYAATYYVRKDGHNTSCNGTVNASSAYAPNCAWLTVGKAASTMFGGDTTYVQSGTYNESITTARSGSSGNYITFQGQGNPVVKRFIVNNHSYIKLDGFKFNLDPDISGWIYVSGSMKYVTISNNEIDATIWPSSDGIFIDGPDSSYITISGNKLHGFTNGVALTTDGSYSLIENNEHYNSTQDFCRCWGINQTIRGNYIHGNTETGNHVDFVQVWGSWKAHDTIVENNIVDCNMEIQPLMISCEDVNNQYGGGCQPTITHHWTFRNNIFIDCMSAFPDAPHVYFYNNTFWHSSSGTHPIMYYPYGSYGIVKNNLFIACNDGQYNVGWYSGGSNFTADYNYVTNGPSYSWSSKSGFAGKEAHGINGGNPLFVNYSTYDFHLQSGSPAKDKGTTISGWPSPKDKDGVSRPQGSAWDIGAYEYIYNGAPVPPSGLKIQ